MPVHVGQITSDVRTTSSTAAAEPATPLTRDWDERARLNAQLRRLERDRRRTATGHGDD